MAFRRAIGEQVKNHADLERFLPGGVHMDYAPQEIDGVPPAVPYAVLTFIATPSSIANDTHRTITAPLVRVMVWTEGRDSYAVEAVERAVRWLDLIFEGMKVTVADPSNDDHPLTGEPIDDTFRVMGFYRELAYEAAEDDSTGNLYTRAGGDYRGTGFYCNACSVPP